MPIFPLTVSGLLSRRWLRFVAVGAIGFLVDALVLAMAYHWLGWAALPARALSFSVAVLITWQLNRHFTFTAARRLTPMAELVRYLGANLVGLAINAGCYVLLVVSFAWLEARPILALIPAALLAAIVSYRGYSHYVFNSGKPG